MRADMASAKSPPEPMSASPGVSLCIINRNGANRLAAVFRAIERQDWPVAEVLLVDNASEDASIETARALDRNVRIVRLPANRGPGAARNAGFVAATHDLILFQDNDIQLGADTVRHLVSHLASHPESLAVAARVLYASEPETIQYDSADCHFLGLMATRNAEVPLYESDTEPSVTTSIVTSCFLINRKIWRGAALFEESFGFNLEDHDFGVRAGLAGHSLWVEPRACVRHGRGTAGLSYRPGQIPSARRLYYLTLNRWKIVSRCYSFRTLVLLAPGLLVYEGAQLVWLVSQGHFRTWWRAISAFARERRSLCEQRRSIQRERRVGDIAFLRETPLPLTRYVREQRLATIVVPGLDVLLRAYWRLVRRWV